MACSTRSVSSASALWPTRPSGVGFLSGTIESLESLSADDFRRHNPRFQGDNLARNLELVRRVREIASAKGVTASQLALAWVLAQGDDVVPIPGTKRRTYLEENVAADDIELTADELRQVSEALPAGAAAGDRYGDMTPLHR